MMEPDFILLEIERKALFVVASNSLAAIFTWFVVCTANAETILTADARKPARTATLAAVIGSIVFWLAPTVALCIPRGLPYSAPVRWVGCNAVNVNRSK